MTGIMRRVVPWIGAALLAAAMIAPAAAHNLEVNPPGTGETIEGWVGGGPLPGQGKGLIPGGPGGIYTISPAHGKGLNTACESLRAKGNGVVDIFGPAPPFVEEPECPHGS